MVKSKGGICKTGRHLATSVCQHWRQLDDLHGLMASNAHKGGTAKAADYFGNV